MNYRYGDDPNSLLAVRYTMAKKKKVSSTENSYGCHGYTHTDNYGYRGIP